MKLCSSLCYLLWFGVAIAQTEQIIFTEISSDIQTMNILNESLAWGDYDNDGDQDLYLTNKGKNRLFRNDGDGQFTDVTDLHGVGHEGFGVGCVFVDLDNDGDLDLYVVNFQAGPDVLYENLGAAEGFAFVDITARAGILDETSSRGVVAIDYDADGHLDLYVNAIGEDLLYKNLGNLTFENRSAALGLSAGGLGVGVVASDFDKNGWIDLFAANRNSDPCALYMNDAGVFADQVEAAGVDARGLGMGVLSFDYNNDGWMDLYWTTWPGEVGMANALYENQGDGSFINVAASKNVTDVPGWGISTNAADINNDGWEDFFVTNGFSEDTGPNVLFLNQEGSHFEDITAVLGSGLFDGRGVAFADFDQDGDEDLCVTGGLNDSTKLYRNDSITGHSFLSLTLQGSTSNRNAVGARIEVTTQFGTYTKEVSGGAGRGSFNSLPVLFGLGQACEVSSLAVYWPSGQVSQFQNIPANRFLEIHEDIAQPILNRFIDTDKCIACDQVVEVIPWVVNNDQWFSKIAISHLGEASVAVCLQATAQNGEVQFVTVSLNPMSLWTIEADQLFPGMTGYSLTIASDEKELYTNVQTFNRETESERSPSLSKGLKLEGLSQQLLFPYLPIAEIPALVLVAPEGVTAAETVMVSAYGSGGLLAETEISLNRNRPYAVLLVDLFPEQEFSEDVMVKVTSDQKLAGTNFVFNNFREPSMVTGVPVALPSSKNGGGTHGTE